MTETRKLRVFLCHSSQDKPIVREFYKRLNAEGWIDPWLDEEKLLPGQDWDLEIEKAVRETDAVVIFLSTNSVDKEGYVQHEIRLVLRIAGYKPEDTIFIIPVRLDNCAIPMRLELQHYVDFFPVERKEWAYSRLFQAFKVRLEQVIKKHEEYARKEKREQQGKRSEEKTTSETSKQQPQDTFVKRSEQIADLRKPVETSNRLKKSKSTLGVDESAIRLVLDQSKWNDKILLYPDIPSSMLKNASSSCSVNKSVSIIGLIDTTVFGSAKEAVLFSNQGIHWCTSGSSYFLPYDELMYIHFKVSTAPLLSKYVSAVSCERPDGSVQVIGIAGGPFRAKDLISVLDTLKAHFTDD